MSTPESKIKARVNKFLKPLVDRGLVHKLMPVQRGFGGVGLDYHLCVGGHYIAIETKADASKKLTPRQEDIRNRIVSAGGAVCVVYDDRSQHIAEQVICAALKKPMGGVRYL